jgi:ferredoxin-thioredoxin reductase catalytic subunit
VAIDGAQTEQTYQQIYSEAEASGYHLNPDKDWCLELVNGLMTNTTRYGYPACPCRLASGEKSTDLDIICPCDYRDPDLSEYGACYCALYVSDEVLQGKRPLAAVPERRPAFPATTRPSSAWQGSVMRLWRCRVCGYLCAREHPPGACPICKAKSDRFEAYILPASAIPVKEEPQPEGG